MSLRLVEQGFAVVCANYRLSPTHPFPAYIEDAATSLKWVYDHIGEYGGDHTSLIVAGGSAGGHIAALLSLDEDYLARNGLSTRNIKVSVPISGLMNVRTAAPTRIRVTWNDDLEKVEKASPLHHVRKDAPPMLLMVADGDTQIRREQNQRMFSALRATGNPDVEFRLLQDRLHNTILPNMANPGDPTVEFMLTFIRKHDVYSTKKLNIHDRP